MYYVHPVFIPVKKLLPLHRNKNKNHVPEMYLPVSILCDLPLPAADGIGAIPDDIGTDLDDAGPIRLFVCRADGRARSRPDLYPRSLLLRRCLEGNGGAL